MISAGLAIGTAFGVLMYAGMPFVDLVAAAPFLAVGEYFMFILTTYLEDNLSTIDMAF